VGGGQGFFVFPLVPNMFLSGSQVLKVFPIAFPKMFPIAPAFYPIWFAQSSTSLFIKYNADFTFVSIFQLEVHLLGGHAQSSKKIGYGQINMVSC
jgi:hypothetical protein